MFFIISNVSGVYSEARNVYAFEGMLSLGWPAEGGEPADEDDPDFPLPGDAPPAHAGRSAALNRSESQANPRPPGSSRAADDASNAQCPASATRPPWFHDSARQDLNGFAAAVAKLEAELAA